ncbi:MAG: hypothetical protein ACJZ9F_11335 [Rhodospirillaceae bacterium]
MNGTLSDAQGNSLTNSTLSDSTLTAHQQETRKLVRAMMVLTQQSASGLAIAAGLTPSTINRFMHKKVKHTLSQRTMLALLTETFLCLKELRYENWNHSALVDLIPVLSVYEQGILELAPDVEQVFEQARASCRPGNGQMSYISESGLSPNLPVLLASSNDINVAEGNFDSAPMLTQRPPFLWNDPNAFAILMPDDRLMPRYDVGDMLYVSPAQSLDSRKIDVALARAGGGFLIGTLIAITDQSIIIGSLYPKVNELHERSQVSGIYRIIGLQRL